MSLRDLFTVNARTKGKHVLTFLSRFYKHFTEIALQI